MKMTSPPVASRAAARRPLRRWPAVAAAVGRAPEGKNYRVDPDFGSTLTVSNRDSQSNRWVHWKIMGQPCEFQVWRRELFQLGAQEGRNTPTIIHTYNTYTVYGGLVRRKTPLKGVPGENSLSSRALCCRAPPRRGAERAAAWPPARPRTLRAGPCRRWRLRTHPSTNIKRSEALSDRTDHTMVMNRHSVLVSGFRPVHTTYLR
jgi:hypothetical protein